MGIGCMGDGRVSVRYIGVRYVGVECGCVDLARVTCSN